MVETGGNVEKGLDWVLGSLDARVTLLERGQKAMQKEIKDELHAISLKNDRQNDKIDALTTAMIASRSSWKAIVWFVGIIATVSTVVATLYQVGVIR